MKKQAKRKAAPKRKTKAKKKVTQAIVLANAPPAPIALRGDVSVIPQIEQTVQNMERVRRFVSKCLNVDLQRELAKLEKKTFAKPEDKQKEEIAIRDRFEIDWGTIPGVDKPFLKQPGAEKFMFWLNLRPKFIARETEMGGGHLEIVAHVVVFSKKTNEEVFEGPDCSCTTMESNYRFRFAEGLAPASDAEKERLKSIGAGKFRKKKIWAHGKFQGEEWVWYERVENPNIHDERNKVRQIGEKRALVKCIRNMGAISEIFTSDPSEWVVEEEGEGSPVDDKDFTPGGRRILSKDGVSPSGRYKTQDAVEREAKEAQAKIVQEKTAPRAAAKGKIEVHWDGSVGHLRGDASALSALLPEIHKKCMAVWFDGDKAWGIPPDDTERLKIIVTAHGYDFVEVQAPGSHPSTALPGPSESSKPETTARKEAGGGVPQGEPPASVVGMIKKATTDTTSAKKIPILRVNIGGQILGCFDKKLWDYILAGVNREAELIVKGARRDIVGIKWIHLRKFEADGHTPIIQQDEDRPTDIPSLFR